MSSKLPIYSAESLALKLTGIYVTGYQSGKNVIRDPLHGMELKKLVRQRRRRQRGFLINDLGASMVSAMHEKMTDPCLTIVALMICFIRRTAPNFGPSGQRSIEVTRS